MPPGRSIRIYLPSGTPSGLRTAELGLSTIKAVVAPRTLLEELVKRHEARRPGVYLLLGDDPGSPGLPQVYVGEGDDVAARLLVHNVDGAKEFFDTVFVFVSKDENLTKAHVRWVEARVIDRLQKANRCSVLNKTTPFGGALPEADVAEMTEYVEQLQLLLSTLGQNLFEPAAHGEVAKDIMRNALVFRFAGEGYDASCEVREGVFVVLRGSIARLSEAPTLPALSRAARRHLADVGVLQLESGGMRFQQDYEFDTASRAAQVVCGFSVNGWNAWRLPDGTTLNAWQARVLALNA